MQSCALYAENIVALLIVALCAQVHAGALWRRRFILLRAVDEGAAAVHSRDIACCFILLTVCVLVWGGCGRAVLVVAAAGES